MATIMGIEMLIVSHRQSFTKYAIAANNMFHTVQDKLSHTPTNFLCSTSTHSTAAETQTHYPPCTFFCARFFKNNFQCTCALVTQDCGDDDDAIDEKPREESQHCEHHEGGWESAGNGEEHPKHVRHQQHDLSAEPEERQSGLKNDKWSSWRSKLRERCRTCHLDSQRQWLQTSLQQRRLLRSLCFSLCAHTPDPTFRSKWQIKRKVLFVTEPSTCVPGVGRVPVSSRWFFQTDLLPLRSVLTWRCCCRTPIHSDTALLVLRQQWRSSAAGDTEALQTSDRSATSHPAGLEC